MIDPILASPATAMSPATPAVPEGSSSFESVLAALAGAAPQLSQAVTRREEQTGQDGEQTPSEQQTSGRSIIDDEINAGRLGVMALVVESRPSLPIASPIADRPPADVVDLSSTTVDLAASPAGRHLPDLDPQAQVTPAVGAGQTADITPTETPVVPGDEQPDGFIDLSEGLPADDQAPVAIPATAGARAHRAPLDAEATATHADPAIRQEVDAQAADGDDLPSTGEPIISEADTTDPAPGTRHVELVGPGEPPAGPVSTPPGRTPHETPTRVAMTNFSGPTEQRPEHVPTPAAEHPATIRAGAQQHEVIDTPAEIDAGNHTTHHQGADIEPASSIEVRSPLAPRVVASETESPRPTVSRMAERIETWIRTTANTPPPRSITLRGAELHGMSIRVSVHADGVAIRLEGAGADDVPWMRHVVEQLQQRGVDVREFSQYDGDGRRRPIWYDEEAQERRRRRPDFDPLLDEHTA